MTELGKGLAPLPPADLPGRLARWVEAGLVSGEQAAAIEDFERAAARKAAAEAERRVPLVAEALGYLGGALVVAALALVIGRRWQDMPELAHLAVLSVATAAVFAGGWAVRGNDDPALGRLGSLLWFLSAAGVGGTVGSVIVDFVEPEGHAEVVRSVLVVFVVMLAWSVPLWRVRPWPLQQLATFAGVTGVVMSAIRLDEDAGPLAFGFALWIIGVGWAVLAWREAVQPVLVGYALGCFAALYAPTAIANESEGGAVLLGLATAAALTAAAVAARRPPLLLAGAVGLFAYLPGAAVYYLGDTLGTELTLLIVGIALLGVAVLMARLRQHVKPEPTERADRR